MIIEGLLTTDRQGTPHLAMMGPLVDRALTQWTLRPFPTSTTYQLLQTNPFCTFHVVDDALLVAQLITGKNIMGKYRKHNEHWILESACRWYALKAETWELGEPAHVQCKLLEKGFEREFWGWNRAKHAVLEAAILCSRLHLLDRQHVQAEFARLKPLVTKTGGNREHQAWQLLEDFATSGGSPTSRD